jgi:DNA-binding CsgD family transcriptional regulator
MKNTLVRSSPGGVRDQTEKNSHVSAWNSLPYTDLEIEVAALSAKGKTPLEIAEKLMISIPMVDDILKTVLAKARGEMRGC